MNISRGKLWLILGAVLGGLAVALGAFGAHVLENSYFSHWRNGREDALATWRTAAQYQMFHALALLAVGWLTTKRCSLCVNLAGTAFTLGTLIFSGLLYALVLTGQKWLGAIVPIGGTLLIAAWVCLAVAAARLPGITSDPPS
jgi:uncharacterized membrane protein YgdD (TMEM256/DUF423 family)